LRRILKRHPDRIPEKGIAVARDRSGGIDAARCDQPSPLRRPGLALMRITPVNEDRGAVERVRQKGLVGIDQKRCGHHPARIGQHSVVGDDRQAFDLQRHRGVDRQCDLV
jgi:hypothetical protein